MMSASLNHCKKMGAEPGRRFLKQPAAKLVIVALSVSCSFMQVLSNLTVQVNLPLSSCFNL